MKTRNRLTRWCMIALAFAMVVVLGCAAPIRTAEAEDVTIIPASDLKLAVSEFEYGSTVELKLQYKQEDDTFADYTGDFTATCSAASGDVNKFLSSAECDTYTITFAAGEGYSFGEENSVDLQVKITQKPLTQDDVSAKVSATSITYGDPLSDSVITCDYGTVAWDDGSKKLSASDQPQTVQAQFTPYETKYALATGWDGTIGVQVYVNKQVLDDDQDISWPTDLKMTYGNKLSSIKLPDSDPNYEGAFTWAAPDSGDTAGVGTQDFQMIFTLSEAAFENYSFANGAKSVTKNVPVKINQRVITEDSIAWPRATDITYGQYACDSDLIVDNPKEDNKYGTFIWGEDAICSPGVGTNYEFTVEFVPTDTNCRTADGGDSIMHKVTLSVKPAQLNEKFTLTTDSVTYQEVDFLSNGTISASRVTATNGDPLNAGEYSLTVKLSPDATETVDEVKNAGVYTVVATAKEGSNYTGSATATFTVNKAELSTVSLTNYSATYKNADFLSDGTIGVPHVKANNVNSPLDIDDYEMSVKKGTETVTQVIDAGTYTVVVTANENSNFTGSVTTNFVVDKAEFYQLTLTQTSSVYNKEQVNIADLGAVLTAGSDGSLTVDPKDYELAAYYEPTNSSKDGILNAGRYSIKVKGWSNDNYTIAYGANAPSADYEVTKAQVTRLELSQSSLPYTNKAYSSDDLKNIVKVFANENDEFEVSSDEYDLVDLGGNPIRDPGDYNISVAFKAGANCEDKNIVTATFTVGSAAVTSFELSTKAITYNGTEVDLDDLTAVVKAGDLTLTRNEDYNLVYTGTDKIMNVNSYEIGIEITNPTYYSDPDKKTATFTVKPAVLNYFALNTTSSTYNREAVDPDTLDATVVAQTMVNDESVILTLDRTDFVLTANKEIKDADTYDISILSLTNPNYTLENASVQAQTYTVNQAVVSSFALDTRNSVYNAKEVALDTLNANVYADNDTLTLNRDEYELTCDKTIQDADDYTITLSKVSSNFTLKDYNGATTDTYTVHPAMLTSFTLENPTAIYNQKAVEPNTLGATATAGENGTLTLNRADFELTCDQIIQDAGDYTIGIKSANKNYTTEGLNMPLSNVFTVTRAKVNSVALDKAGSIYSQEAVDPATLTAVVKATTDGEDIVLPLDAYELVCGEDILQAGDYTIGVKLVDEVNYEDPDAITDTYTVAPAQLDQLTLGVDSLIYSQAEVDLTALQPIVTAATNDGRFINLPYGDADAAYELVFNGNDTDTVVKDAGDYTLEVKLLDTRNYEGAASAIFTVDPAQLAQLTLGVESLIYSQAEVDLTALQPTATAETNDGQFITLPYGDADAAYEVVFNGNDTDTTVMNAGDYTLEVKLLDTRNYAGDTSAVFTVTPAQLSQLTLGVNTLIYDQADVDLTALQPTVTAETNDGGIITLPYGNADAAYAVVFYANENDVTVKNAGAYELNVYLLDTRNYAGDATAEFVVTPAKVKQLTLGVKQSVYDRNAVDLTMLEPTVTAVTNGDEIITLPYGDENAAYCIDGAEAVTVGEYVFAVKLIDERNYVADTDITDTYEILRMPVAPLAMACNVTNSDGEFVLGGPVSEGHRTITIKGEPNELVYVVVNGAVQSDLIALDESGVATLTVNGDGMVGKLTLGEKAELVLDGSGEGQAFVMNVVYEDAANLRDGQEETAPAVPQASYRYDMEAVKVNVAQLYNRSAQGVVVDLTEDLAEIAFASRGDARITFSGSRTAMAKGDGQVIGFSGTNKLNSTALDPASLYNVTYTDLVGNTGAVEELTVERASGTLKIESVDPALNSSKRIGRSDKLTWTITCSPSGSSEEKVTLTIGNKSFSSTLKPGSNAVVVDAGRLQTDVLLNVRITFEDLTGEGTFEGFVYDERCDVPVLTSSLYSECYVLTGMVEPGSRVVLRVNNERVDVKIDSFGTFAANMPVVYEGDKVDIIVTDLADNVTSASYVVGPAMEMVQLKAYMLGKIYTDAHTVKDGEEPRWTTITTVTKDELMTGKVDLPIVAGNMTQVGTMTMTMDDKGGISYDYELNEGVVLVSEDVRVYTTRSKEDSMEHTGVLLSRGEATQVPNKKDTYYVTAEFVVEVGADQLTTTFQLESASKSELKMGYRDRQNNKPLK